MSREQQSGTGPDLAVVAEDIHARLTASDGVAALTENFVEGWKENLAIGNRKSFDGIVFRRTDTGHSVSLYLEAIYGTDLTALGTRAQEICLATWQEHQAQGKLQVDVYIENVVATAERL